MKKVDFLFIYENRVRELENICLLKYELEKRGYSVEIVNTWYYVNKKKLKIYPKVVVLHSLRNDAFFDFVLPYASYHIKKIINLQCEQIGKNIDELIGSPVLNYSGVIPNQGIHLSWGENNRKRLINVCGFDRSKVFLTGHVALDFGRKEFNNYYLSRKKLFEIYKIPESFNVCLFISSFVYVNLPTEILKDANRYSDNDLFQQLSHDSFSIIVDWIKKALLLYPDYVFIYRPHPSEANNSILLSYKEKEKRFFIIDELSVKQWIKACDKVYTWISTSVAEAYIFNKPCMILRPIELPQTIDMNLFKNANFICTESDFLKSLCNETNISMDSAVFNDYYYINPELPAYKRIVEIMEHAIDDKRFIIKDPRKIIAFNLFQCVKQILHYLYKSFILIFYFNSKINITTEIDDYTRQLQIRNYATKGEINAIVKHIKSTLENNNLN